MCSPGRLKAKESTFRGFGEALRPRALGTILAFALGTILAFALGTILAFANAVPIAGTILAFAGAGSRKLEVESRRWSPDRVGECWAWATWVWHLLSRSSAVFVVSRLMHIHGHRSSAINAYSRGKGLRSLFFEDSRANPIFKALSPCDARVWD